MNTESVPRRTFGQWLLRQLKRRDWTQADLAKRLKVENSVVSRWTRDERSVSPEKLNDIADVLSMRRNDVLAIAGLADPDPDVDPDSNLAEILGLVHAVDWEWDEDRMDHIVPLLRKWAESDRRRELNTRGLNDDGKIWSQRAVVAARIVELLSLGANTSEDPDVQRELANLEQRWLSVMPDEAG